MKYRTKVKEVRALNKSLKFTLKLRIWQNQKVRKKTNSGAFSAITSDEKYILSKTSTKVYNK